jgi:phosphohistidine swiveling domain-containing protein
MCTFSSKARTLNFVKNIVVLFKIPDLLHFKVDEFQLESTKVLKNIETKFCGHKVAIRSSAADEDGKIISSAGEYESILNVPSSNLGKVTKAVNRVISSYENKRLLMVGDEVIVQKMVSDTTMSGVVFTHDLNTGAPYYVINYDDQSGLTDTVTSGDGVYANRTLYIHRDSVKGLHSERFIKLLQAVQELEKAMESQFLDIEFALGKDLTPYLLQVRAITTQSNWNRAISKQINSSLKGVEEFVIERFKRMKGVYGDTTILGQMPDWNPVEMIGRAPRALALSLYQMLITDSAWSKARAIMGYAVPNNQPLMLTLAGQPFIDTRLSFHSYLPKTVSPIIAEKLTNHWIKRLGMSPELHDKIEFEVAITTYSFDIDEKIEKLVEDALTDVEKDEFKREHLRQTQKLIKGNCNGSIQQALDKIDLLSQKQRNSGDNFKRNISSLFSMIDDCVQLGTTPFSILARHGFIAKTILLSLEKSGIFTNNEIDQIQASVKTIAGSLVDDMHSLNLGKMSNSDFMERYGHLRPGTYDIMSCRYDQMNSLFDDFTPPSLGQSVEVFKLSIKQKMKINRLLEDNNFKEFDASNLLDYINNAIIGREYGKFIFTRTVSDMIEIIANFAEDHGLSRDEISHVPLNFLLDTVKASSEFTIEERLRGLSFQESKKHDVSVSIRLPQLLIDQFSVYIVPFQVSCPNFITHEKITAGSIVLYSDTDGGISLTDKIVIIEGADPGFDWIFSKKISGLITKYGGVNSHMAIRCAEFGIPAAIGCGEQRFDLLLKANQVHLDCAAGLVSPIH